MKNGPIQLSRRSRRVSIALGYALARLYRLCYRIQFSGIGVSLIPGLPTCNMSFRAGGRVEPTIYPSFSKYILYAMKIRRWRCFALFH